MEQFKAARLHGKEILNIFGLLGINRFLCGQNIHSASRYNFFHSSTNISLILRDVNNAEWVLSGFLGERLTVSE